MAGADGGFSGDLGLIGLFDLGQLLLLNRATGTLAVTREGTKGFLFFEDGQVVNALDDEQREGETAAFRVFVWRAGRFEFRPGPPGTARRIGYGTEGLMLEAARRLDEASVGTPGEAAAETLRERRGAFEALRQAFHTAAHDVNDTRSTGEAPGVDLLGALVGPDDRLLFRPGRPPLHLGSPGWLPATSMPLAPGEHEQLRASLLEGAEHVRRFAAAGGRQLEAVSVGRGEDEALWVRCVGAPSFEPPMLEGPSEVLHRMLDEPEALVLAGAPTLADARHLLQALAALAANRRAGTVLVVGTRVPAPSHAAPGLVLHAAHDEAAAWMDAAQPGVAALAPGPLPERRVLEHLASVPLVLAAVVAADLASLEPRWRAALALAGADALGDLFAALPTGLVVAHPAGEPGAPLRFTASLRPRRGTTTADDAAMRGAGPAPDRAARSR